MNRLLYLYPEEWTGRRAREIHTLSTCVALARAGRCVTLVTAGGSAPLRQHLHEIAGADSVPGLELIALSRSIGPVRSAAVFAVHFRRGLRRETPFAHGFAIHLKAAALLHRSRLPCLYEAHEIFAETPRAGIHAQGALENLERAALIHAWRRVATSAALAAALCARYRLADDFVIVPNAGGPPLRESVARADGPVVYAGSIADWKGLDCVIEAARKAQVPLRIVGGTESEWRALAAGRDVGGVDWRPRVPVEKLPEALNGARAGLVPTRPESGSGRYSCPMKLFDYARCGLPVITTALPSLATLAPGSWRTLVTAPTAEAWAAALRNFQFDAGRAREALRWAGLHTWDQRAKRLFPD